LGSAANRGARGWERWYTTMFETPFGLPLVSYNEIGTGIKSTAPAVFLSHLSNE